MGANRARKCCKLDAESRGYVEHAMERMNFSVRAHDRILKVARILADHVDIRKNRVAAYGHKPVEPHGNG